MRKLALSSIDVLSFRHLTDKPFQELRVIFIPTAADTYVDKWFIDRDRKILHESGITFSELTIADKTKDALEDALKGVDVIIVAGGNTFYLLEKIRESGFDEVINRLISQGIIYVGLSAGAVIAGPHIEPVKYFDEPEDAPSLKSYEGLGFVDFVILPHYDPQKHNENFDKAIEDCKRLGLRYQVLTDKQSILVEDDSWQVR